MNQKSKHAPKVDPAHAALRRIAEARRIAEEGDAVREHHTSRWVRRKAAHQAETNSWSTR